MDAEDEVKEIEELFLVRQYDECLKRAVEVLRKGEHDCWVGQRNDSPSCSCVRLAALIVQSLFELQRFGEIEQTLHAAYGNANIPNDLPCDVVTMWSQVLLYTNKHSAPTRALLEGYLRHNARRLAAPQRRSLLELLVVHVLLPAGEFTAAEQLICTHSPDPVSTGDAAAPEITPCPAPPAAGDATRSHESGMSSSDGSDESHLECVRPSVPPPSPSGRTNALLEHVRAARVEWERQEETRMAAKRASAARAKEHHQHAATTKAPADKEAKTSGGRSRTPGADAAAAAVARLSGSPSKWSVSAIIAAAKFVIKRGGLPLLLGALVALIIAVRSRDRVAYGWAMFRRLVLDFLAMTGVMTLVDGRKWLA